MGGAGELRVWKLCEYLLIYCPSFLDFLGICFAFAHSPPTFTGTFLYVLNACLKWLGFLFDNLSPISAELDWRWRNGCRSTGWLFLFAVLMAAALLFCMVFFVSTLKQFWMNVDWLWLDYYVLGLGMRLYQPHRPLQQAQPSMASIIFWSAISELVE